MDAFTSDSRQIYLNRATHISLNGERAVNPRLLKSDQDGIEIIDCYDSVAGEDG